MTLDKRVSDIARHVGQRVRQARVVAHPQVAKHDIARMLGISTLTYNGFENGKGYLTPEKLWLLADFHGKPVEWFFHGLPQSRHEKPSEDPFTVLAQTEDGLQMAKAFNRIDSPEVRVKLVELLWAVGR